MTEQMQLVLVDEAKSGNGADIACGMMGIDMMAAILFLRKMEDSTSAHTVVAAHCRRMAMLAMVEAAKIAKAALGEKGDGTSDEEVKSLAGTLACAIVGNALAALTMRACGLDSSSEHERLADACGKVSADIVRESV